MFSTAVYCFMMSSCRVPSGPAELYMLGEAGEVIDVMKKHGQEVLTGKGEVRSHLVEEMADTMMFFMDTLACLDVSPQEFALAYAAKHDRNMRRWD